MDKRAHQRAKKYANRRRRLKRLIDERANGVAARFGEMYGFSRQLMAQYLSETYQGGHSPGEGIIEKLEDKTGVEIGWFDVTDDDPKSWPFLSIDESKVHRLNSSQLGMIEIEMLRAADMAGLDIKKEG